MDQEAPPEIRRLPQAPGVYRFRDAGGAALYIGRATTLRSRVASYWSDPRDRVHLAPMVASVAGVEAVACDSAHEAAWLERNLLQTALPPWNRTPGGQPPRRRHGRASPGAAPSWPPGSAPRGAASPWPAD